MAKHVPRLLVVGGTGFIGRNVAARAVTLGWDVTTVSLRSTTPAAGTRHIAANIADAEALRVALPSTSFEYVVNCGGYVDHTPFAHGGRSVFEDHLTGLLNLALLLDRDELRGFVNIGSSDEYGGAPAPQRETQREAPIAPYSLGKAAATHALQMLHRTEGFPAVSLRPFLTYGPGQDTRRFLPQIIASCLANKSFPASAGEQLRDLCYIDDTVDAILTALTTRAAFGEVFNVASGQPVSIRRIIEMVQQLIGGGTPRFGEVAYRTGENMELYADITKARAILGWEPKTSLEQGISNTIAYMKALSE